MHIERYFDKRPQGFLPGPLLFIDPRGDSMVDKKSQYYKLYKSTPGYHLV